MGLRGTGWCAPLPTVSLQEGGRGFFQIPPCVCTWHPFPGLGIVICLAPHWNWLNVAPSCALGLHLQDREFRLCLDYWLGLCLMVHGTPCPFCASEKMANLMGNNYFGCGGNGGRIHWHDSLRYVLFCCCSICCPCSTEESSHFDFWLCHSCPANVFLPNWSRGCPAALDVTVISALQDLIVAGAAIMQGHALRIGEERKMAAHRSDCQATGISFVPLFVEILGGWSEEAVHTIGRIGRFLRQHSGIPPSESTHHLFQPLFVCLWRGNASMWLDRLPFDSAWVDRVT